MTEKWCHMCGYRETPHHLDEGYKVFHHKVSYENAETCPNCANFSMEVVTFIPGTLQKCPLCGSSVGRYNSSDHWRCDAGHSIYRGPERQWDTLRRSARPIAVGLL